MSTIVITEDVTSRLPSGTFLTSEDTERIKILIGDAEEIVRDEFSRVGKDFTTEIKTPWVGNSVKRVIREMVAAAVILGPNAGVRSASSSTGQVADSVTYDKVDIVGFSGVRITDDQRRELGIPTGAFPRGRTRRPIQRAEVPLWRR